MHPQHQAAAILGAVCPDAKGANFLGTGEHRLKDELEGQALGNIQFGDDLLRVRGHLSNCFLAIKVLAAGQKPDFGGFKVFHEVTWGECAGLHSAKVASSRSFKTSTKRARTELVPQAMPMVKTITKECLS